MWFKRIISLILVMAFLAGLVPVNSFAAEPQGVPEMDTGDVTIQGTNGFGNLLTQAITEEQNQTESEYDGSYTVTDLKIQGNTATVTYDSMEEAILIVALYTEDGMQMLTSAKTTVSPDAKEATVTFVGDMPQYFRAEAYMVDSYDFSPLCTSYATPLYTREMQELLASTIHDYDADRVLNLDEDETTNFAVYADTTKVIEPVAGKNIVASVNEETATYVIENADGQFTSLQVGDIVAYPYGENEILVVKVANIRVNGTTVTITGGQMEMQDAFAAVKIESGDSTQDLVVDESTVPEGVTYEGIGPGISPNQVSPMDVGGAEISDTAKFSVDKKLVGDDDNKVEIVGAVEFSVNVTLNYYVTLTQQYVEFRLKGEIKGGFSLSGTLVFEQKLCDAAFYPIPIINIGIEPTFKVEVTGQINFSVSCASTIGFIYDDETGAQPISEKPEVSYSVEAEATVFFGLDFKPQIEVAEGTLAEFEIGLPFGMELKITETGNRGKKPTGKEQSYHDCERCLKLDLYFKIEVAFKLSFLKTKWLTIERTPISTKLALGYGYYSLDNKEGNFGKCHNLVYRLTVSAQDVQGNPAAGVPITIKNLRYKTNAHGNVVAYLPDGVYTVSCDFGDSTAEKLIILDRAKKLTLKEDAPKEPENIFEEKQEQPEEEENEDDPFFGAVDESGMIASGIYGETGDRYAWEIDGAGHMTLRGLESYPVGTGAFYPGDVPPWYEYRYCIKTVHFEEIYTIEYGAFQDCQNLKSVTMDDAVEHLWAAFKGCQALETIEFSPNLTFIGNNALHGCTSLRDVALPDSLLTIGGGSFCDCVGLTSLTIPQNVNYIGEWVFLRCTNLKTIKFIGNAPEFAYNAFSGLTATVYYPENNSTWTESVRQNYEGNITWVPYTPDTNVVASGTCGAKGYDLNWTLDSNGLLVITGEGPIQDSSLPWSGMKEQIKEIRIGEGVTLIPVYAFSNCKNLVRLSLPNTLTKIKRHAFSYCDKLSLVTIPDSVQVVEKWAFVDCPALEMLTVGSNTRDIQESAFGRCYSLKTIIFRGGDIASSNCFYAVCATAYYPAGEWREHKLTGYGGTITWIPYTLDEDGNMIIDEDGAITVTSQKEGTLNPNAVFGGEYGTEVTENYTLKTASFKNLVPGGEYLLLAVKRIDGEDPLAADNLLYVDQAMAGEDGTVKFTYVQRENANVSYVVACGPSNKDLKNATITFPDMTADGEVQAVNPTVVYNGKTLVEEKDYVLTGDVSFEDGGTYTCYVRGIRDYTGTVECTYTVKADENENYVKWYSGTTSLNGTIDLNIYVLLSDDLVKADDTYVRFTYAGKTVDVPMAKAMYSPLDSALNRYRFSCPVYAKQLTDSVNVKFMKGDQMIGTELNYSVVTYCKNRINKSNDPAEVALCKALLNYGTASQQLFGYNTENLANESLSAADKVLKDVNASAYKYSVSGSEAGIKAKSATLMLEDVVKVRVYFTLTGDKTIDQYTFTIDGKMVTPSYNDRGYYVETSGIAAKDLEKMFQVKVGGITVTYGALSYVNSKVGGSNVLEASISKALYAYWQAAEALLG